MYYNAQTKLCNRKRWDEITDEGYNCINNAEPLHSCPFQREVNSNYEPYCNCYDECVKRCAMDV